FSLKSEQNIRLKIIIDELCTKYEAQENQILLAFLTAHPAKILPVVGTSKAETIREFSESLAIKMQREDWFKLLQASEGKEVD
ncbi:MAG: aldo/keto reductase, partial [Kaistella sp.]